MDLTEDEQEDTMSDKWTPNFEEPDGNQIDKMLTNILKTENYLTNKLKFDRNQKRKVRTSPDSPTFSIKKNTPSFNNIINKAIEKKVTIKNQLSNEN